MEKPVTNEPLIMSDREAFDQMAKQVNEIHTVLFGAEGQGGVQRRVTALEEEQKAIRATLGKMAGIGIAVSAIFGALGSKILNILGGPK